jgi:hypothetical protein
LRVETREPVSPEAVRSLLTHEAHPLQRVSLSRAGDTRPLQTLPKATRRAATPYPGHWRKLPFELELEVRLVFRRPLSEEQVATVEERLLTWAAAASMGAYSVHVVGLGVRTAGMSLSPRPLSGS